MSNEQLKFELVLETNKAVNDIKQMLNKTNVDAEKSAKEGGKKAGIGFSDAFNLVVLNQIGQQITTALQNVVRAGITEYARLDDQLSNVKKTTGLAGEEAEAYKNAIFELGKVTRTPIEDLLRIGVVGGQFGVAKENIEEFTKSMNILSVALGEEFPNGTEEATTEVYKLGNVFKEFRGADGSVTTDSILRIGNAINLLGAEGAATAPVITNMAGRIGGAGAVFGMTAGDALGLSAALEEMAVNPERGASTVTRLLKVVSESPKVFADVVGMSAKEFTNLVNTDINQALVLVADKVAGGELSVTEFSKTLDDLGVDGVFASEILSKIGQNSELVATRQDQANKALENTDSITGEYNEKNNNLAASLEKSANRITILKSNLGQALAPTLEKVLDIVSPFVDKLGAWIKENPQLVTGILLVVGAVGSLLIGLLPVISIVSSLSAIWPALTAAFATTIWPITLVVLAIVGVMAMLTRLYNESAVFRDGINQIFAQLQLFMQNAITFFNTNIMPSLDVIWAEMQIIIKELIKAFEQMWPFIKPFVDIFVSQIGNSMDRAMNTLRGVVDIVKGVLQLISGVLTGDGAKVREGFSNIFRGLGDVAKQALNAVIDSINASFRSMNEAGNALERLSGGKVNVADLPQIPRFAKGGDFVVPPGYPNDSYLMRVQSGERVIVQTPAQQANQNINSNNQSNVTNIIYTNQNLFLPTFMTT